VAVERTPLADVLGPAWADKALVHVTSERRP
jgi:hypothetical protein